MLFGEKLKKLRTDRGMSQSDLADALGVTRRSIIYYESGKRYPKTQDFIKKTAALFTVSADYLLSDSDNFVMKAEEQFGAGGKRDATEIVNKVSALFAGGSLNDSDKDKVFKAISDIYWESKELNKKYGNRE